MKTLTQRLGIIALSTSLLGTSLAAQADPQGSASQSATPHSGLYLGGHYGRFSSDGEDFDENNDFYDVVVGALITPYIGIEGGYSDFGSLKGQYAEADLTGYSIAGLLRIPLGSAVGLYAKGGQFFWRSDINVTVLGQRYATDIEGNEPFYGVGADFFLTEHLNLDVEYLRYKVDLSDSSLPDVIDDYETDIDTAKVGLRFFF